MAVYDVTQSMTIAAGDAAEVASIVHLAASLELRSLKIVPSIWDGPVRTFKVAIVVRVETEYPPGTDEDMKRWTTRRQVANSFRWFEYGDESAVVMNYHKCVQVADGGA